MGCIPPHPSFAHRATRPGGRRRTVCRTRCIIGNGGASGKALVDDLGGATLTHLVAGHEIAGRRVARVAPLLASQAPADANVICRARFANARHQPLARRASRRSCTVHADRLTARRPTRAVKGRRVRDHAVRDRRGGLNRPTRRFAAGQHTPDNLYGSHQQMPVRRRDHRCRANNTVTRIRLDRRHRRRRRRGRQSYRRRARIKPEPVCAVVHTRAGRRRQINGCVGRRVLSAVPSFGRLRPALRYRGPRRRPHRIEHRPDPLRRRVEHVVGQCQAGIAGLYDHSRSCADVQRGSINNFRADAACIDLVYPRWIQAVFADFHIRQVLAARVDLKLKRPCPLEPGRPSCRYRVLSGVNTPTGRTGQPSQRNRVAPAVPDPRITSRRSTGPPRNKCQVRVARLRTTNVVGCRHRKSGRRHHRPSAGALSDIDPAEARAVRPRRVCAGAYFQYAAKPIAMRSSAYVLSGTQALPARPFA